MNCVIAIGRLEAPSGRRRSSGGLACW